MTPEGIARIKREEGFRGFIYNDQFGNPTIGYGTNLKAGISQAQAEALLTLRLDTNEMVIRTTFPWFEKLSDRRKDVIEDMCYQLGVAGVMQFRLFVKAIEAGDFNEAANQMIDSVWYRQTPNRVSELAMAFREG